MALFSKKKQKQPESDSHLPNLPDLPDFPGAQDNSLNFPKFEETEGDQKFAPPGEETMAAQIPIDDFPKLEPLQSEIPQRQKPKPQLNMVHARPNQMHMSEEFAAPVAEPEEFSRPVHHSSKPIYVKIAKFQEAANAIDKIKDKIREADHILEEISRLRAEEDKELELWHADLASIRSRLLKVDQSLFGNQ